MLISVVMLIAEIIINLIFDLSNVRIRDFEIAKKLLDILWHVNDLVKQVV